MVELCYVTMLCVRGVVVVGGGGLSCGGPIQCKGMGGEEASGESNNNSEEGGENS